MMRMHDLSVVGAALAAAVLLAGCASSPRETGEPAPTRSASQMAGIDVPYEYYRLDNGLRVVLSRHASVPTATVAVHYNIGTFSSTGCSRARRTSARWSSSA